MFMVPDNVSPALSGLPFLTPSRYSLDKYSKKVYLHAIFMQINQQAAEPTPPRGGLFASGDAHHGFHHPDYFRLRRDVRQPR
jgi:hypothetical protein